MTRLLIRSGKDPFTPVSPEATLAQDVFHNNVGNYLYTDAVHRALMVPGTELVSNGTLSEVSPPGPGDAERINEAFDGFVVPLANAFRPGFRERLANLTSLIERLDIPTTVVGVGAQAGLDLDDSGLRGIAPLVTRFARAVLDRSAVIGVRGEFTKNYLAGLGFGDAEVEVIGCPSVFMYGDSATVSKNADGLSRHSELTMNLSPKVRNGIGKILQRHAETYPNLTYVGQDMRDLALLLYGQPPSVTFDPDTPTSMHHRLYQEDRMRMYVDGWTWMDYLGSRDFVFGTRLHGNVAALLAGTPAMLLAHDSRTLELAEYHAIPCRPITSVSPDADAADLYAEADIDAFHAALPKGLSTYRGFLDSNSLAHVFTGGEVDEHPTREFDKRVAKTRFHGPVRPLTSGDGTELAARLQWLRDVQLADTGAHPGAYRYPFSYPLHPGTATSGAEALELNARKIRKQSKRLTRLERRVEALENRTARRGGGRLVRRALAWVARRGRPG